MTPQTSMDFLKRMHALDRSGLTPRDILLLWAIRTQPGMMGLELAKKLGYKSRSSVQDGIGRLIDRGYIEDRRPFHNQVTPNDLYILSAGETALDAMVPS